MSDNYLLGGRKMAGPIKDKKDEASIPKRRLVINCHGGITTNPLSLNPNTALITPGALNANYIFSVNRDYNIEKDFLSGKLKQVSPGNWNVYGTDSKNATDVSLTPWQSERDKDHPTYSIETVQFAKKILESDSLWSDIDGDNRRYLDRDPDAVLVIEKNGGIEYLRGKKAIAEFFADMRNIDSNTLGVPLMFYAPRVGKVKVLEHTSLSSVLGYLERIAPGQTTVVLACCNANPDPSVPNPRISYLETSAEMDVDDMVEKVLKGTKAKVDSKVDSAAVASATPTPAASSIFAAAATAGPVAPTASTKAAAASVSSVSNVTIARRGGKEAFEGLAIGFGSAGEASKFLEALKGAASASKVSVEGQLQVDGNNVIIKPSIGKGTFGAYVTRPPANEHALSFGNKAFREEFVKLLNMNVSRKDSLSQDPSAFAVGPPLGPVSNTLYFNSKMLPITSNAPTLITVNKATEEKKTSSAAPTPTPAASSVSAAAAAAPAAPEASTKAAVAAAPVLPPTIVRRGDKGFESLALGFNSKEAASQFAQALYKAALASGVLVEKHLEVEENTVIVKPAGGKGNFGVFMTRAGEPTINFNNTSFREEFIKLLGMNVKRALKFEEKDSKNFAIAPPGSGSGAIYFNPNFVSTTPSPIVTTATPAATSPVTTQTAAAKVSVSTPPPASTPATSAVSAAAVAAAVAAAAAGAPVPPIATASTTKIMPDQKGEWENRIAMIEKMKKDWEAEVASKEGLEKASLAVSINFAQELLTSLRKYLNKGDLDKFVSETNDNNSQILSKYRQDNPDLFGGFNYKKELLNMIQEIKDLASFKELDRLCKSLNIYAEMPKGLMIDNKYGYISVNMKGVAEQIQKRLQELGFQAPKTFYSSQLVTPADAAMLKASNVFETHRFYDLSIDDLATAEEIQSKKLTSKAEWERRISMIEKIKTDWEKEKVNKLLAVDKINLEIIINYTEEYLKFMREHVTKGEFDKIGSHVDLASIEVIVRKKLNIPERQVFPYTRLKVLNDIVISKGKVEEKEKKASSTAPVPASTVTSAASSVSAAAVAAAVAAAAAAAPVPPIATVAPASSAPDATKLSKEAAAKISATIGRFSKYAAADGNSISGGTRQGALAKKMINQLNPEKGWENSHVTQLSQPLKDQADATVTIQAKSKDEENAFGAGVVTISKSTLKKLSDSAQIVTNSKRVTRELFLKIQKELYQHINPQDKRTLETVILVAGGKENGQKLLEDWRNSWKELGFSSAAELEVTLKRSMLFLATNICHAQEAHFFIEQEKRGDLALNKLRNDNLDKQVPNVILSIPGINVAYGGMPVKTIDGVLFLGRNQKTDTGVVFNPVVTVEECITNMWEAVLDGAVLQDVRNLSMPAIGLGAFAGEHEGKIAPLYFQSLFKLLSSEKYKGKFDNVFFNPMAQGKAFDAELVKFQKELTNCNCNVVNFNGDVLLLGVELAKQGHRCALLNPSDADVTWGVYDVGEYYKFGNYVGEEHIGATSTAMLGSRGVNDVYTNPNKIKSTKEIAAILASSKTAAATVTPPAPSSVSAAATPAASSVSVAAAPAAPASSTKVVAATTPVSPPTIARRGGKEKEAFEGIAIGFNSPGEALQFAQILNKKAGALRIPVGDRLQIDGNTVIIRPSRTPGAFGAYVTGANEHALNFGDPKLRKEFIELLNMDVHKKDALSEDPSAFAVGPPMGPRAGTIYFNSKILPTTSNASIPIVLGKTTEEKKVTAASTPAPTVAAPATSSVSAAAAPAAAAAVEPAAPAKTVSDQKGIWEKRMAMIERMNNEWAAEREKLLHVGELSPKQKIEAISLETSMRFAQAFLNPLREFIKKGEFDKITSELFSPGRVGNINYEVMTGYSKDNPKYLKDLPEELQELSPYKKEFMDMIMNIVQEGQTPAAPTVSAAAVAAATAVAAASGPVVAPAAPIKTITEIANPKEEWEKRIAMMEKMKEGWETELKKLETLRENLYFEGKELSPEQKVDRIFLACSILGAQEISASLRGHLNKGEFDKMASEIKSYSIDRRVMSQYARQNPNYIDDMEHLPDKIKEDFYYRKELSDMIQEIRDSTPEVDVTSNLAEEWRGTLYNLDADIDLLEKNKLVASTDKTLKFSEFPAEISRDLNYKLAIELRNRINERLKDNDKVGLENLFSKKSLDQMLERVRPGGIKEKELHSLNGPFKEFFESVVERIEEQRKAKQKQPPGGLGF